jgi:hypothetical protein
MPAGLNTHQRIRQVKTTSGNSPLTTGQIGEAAGQLFVGGSPVMKSTGTPAGSAGYIVAWDGTTLANPPGILGISQGDANNLATNAKGAPQQPFGSVQLGANLTFGSVVNQPTAVNIPRGAPLADGRLVIDLAVPDTWFEAQIDNNSTGTAVIANTLVGSQYGLTIGPDGKTWFVDLAKTGASAAVVIKQINPADALGTPFGRVWFSFLPTVGQLLV